MSTRDRGTVTSTLEIFDPTCNLDSAEILFRCQELGICRLRVKIGKVKFYEVPHLCLA